MCIVAWPAKIQPDATVRQQYVHAVDVVPTIYELLGVVPPTTSKGHVQSPLEGESFAASLTDPNVESKETQFYAMLGQRSIYHDGWLACTLHPPMSGWGHFESDVWELYHLDADRAQSENVAEKESERLQALRDH
jgi:arylsulfatase